MTRTITAIIFLGGAIAIFFTWSQPYFYEVRELKAEKVSLDGILENSKEIQAEKIKLLSGYNSIPQENLERLNKLLPSRADSIKFIPELDDIVQRSGMVLKDIDISKTVSDQEKVDFGDKKFSFEKVILRIKVVGSYESFNVLLGNIAANLRLIDITGVKFSTGEGDKNLYEFSIDAVTYWKK